MTAVKNSRKAREAKKHFQRRGTTRKKQSRILILTEGEKTEPLYLKDFCKYYGIHYIRFDDNSYLAEKPTWLAPGVEQKENSASNSAVCIEGKKVDSAPISIANFAEKEIQKQEDGEPYWNKIYCVFDKDSHPTFKQALNKIKKLNRNTKDITIEAFISDICFELWFFIHYQCSSKPHEQADSLIAELKKIKDCDNNFPFSSYKKNKKAYFHTTKGLLKDAIKNAFLLEKDVQSNSLTQIHMLIRNLLDEAPQSCQEATAIKEYFDSIAKS